MKRFSFVSGLIFILVGCNGSDARSTVAAGQWGGANVELEVTDVGASALFKCGATGSVNGPLSLDSSARFDAMGTYEPKLVQGGPRPAEYSGSLMGSRMALDVRIGQDPPQHFDLTLGQAGRFDVCNF